MFLPFLACHKSYSSTAEVGSIGGFESSVTTAGMFIKQKLALSPSVHMCSRSLSGCFPSRKSIKTFVRRRIYRKERDGPSSIKRTKQFPDLTNLNPRSHCYTIIQKQSSRRHCRRCVPPLCRPYQIDNTKIC